MYSLVYFKIINPIYVNINNILFMKTDLVFQNKISKERHCPMSLQIALISGFIEENRILISAFSFNLLQDHMS